MVRDQRSWNRFAILLVAICVTIDTVHTEIFKDPTYCSRTKCKVPASRKFKYEEGISYWYRYSVDVSTNLGGPPGHARNESTLRLDADLVVRFTSPCEGTLKFRNASISHDPEKYNPEFPDRAGGEFKRSLERHVLRFAFDDGRIDELCPERQEPLWALNLKRGVLSMLQNTMHRFDVDRRVNELDVNGVCETSYHLYKPKRTSLLVKKTKNLSDCAYGSKHFSVIQSNYYRSPRSGSRALQHPLVESRSDCELTIDHNVYQQVVCKDLHQLQPFSTNSTGARTESTAVLRLINEAKDDEDEYEMNNEDDVDDDEEEENEKQSENEWDLHAKRTTLIYDYSRSSKTIHGELRTSRNLLITLCRFGVKMDEYHQRFPEMFTRFVHSARLLDYLSLSQLFIRANFICSTGQKHIMDALPFMGSNAAVHVMKNQIIKKSVDQATLDKWVMAFTLIPQPNQETIRILSPLLEFQRQIPNAQFVLSYSATIRAFCSAHEARCSNVEQVTRFLSYLEQKVAKGCVPRVHSPSTVKDTIEALKAIGNMGLETESILTQLKECIDDQSGFLPMEVRVAAVDAHRRMPSCEKTRDLFFLNYYKNFTLDTEIRIASYLQVMRCPDYNVVKTIKHTLKMEEVNQVGTFVWSHLTNLYNSASPTMVEIQSLLTDRDLGNKFNSDRRKFSRNYDGSFFSEEYNFGANYHGNLIFSPRSYIPRSASFNVSFDLFGRSVNAFELNTRFEGLEYYAEKFFGPDGPYSNEKMSRFFTNFLRRFRSAPEEDYWKRVKRIPNVIDNNFDNPRISYGYKLFGNDLKYYVLNNDQEIREALVRLDPWEKFKQIGKEFHYENAMMFLDSTYVIPMSSGLPVRLDFAGSAACNFMTSGVLDIKRLAFNEMELISNLTSSMSVSVVGSMTVDAFYKSAGIKLRSNVYTSGAVQIHLDVKGMRLILLNMRLPNKKMNVISIGTDILLTKSNGAELEEKPLGVLIVDQNDKNTQSVIVRDDIISNTNCSWSGIDRLVGLKLCVDYQLSNTTKNLNAPYFILSGPTLFKISLIKADPTADSYLMKYEWKKTEKQNLFRFIFNTPGSQVNRELSAAVSFDTKTNNVTVLLRSAENSIVAEGTYKSTENETFIDIGFDINGTKHLDASVGYSIKRFAYGYTFRPQVHLIINNERIAALSGAIRNVRKNNVFQCDVDLTFRTKKVWSKLVGYIVQRNVSLAADIQLEYQLQKMPKKETLQLEVSLSNRSSKTLTHKAAELKLHSTAYPQLNAVITAWYQQALGHLELQAKFNSKPHLMDERHTLTAQLILSYSKMYFQNQDTKVSASIAVTKPIENLDIKISVQHYAMGPESKTSLLIGYAPEKKISLTVILVMPRGLMFSMEAHVNLTIPNFNSMLLSARIIEHSKHTYALNFSGTWFSGHNVTIGGTYSDQSVASVVSHNLKLNLKSPSFANNVLLYCRFYRNYSDIIVDLNMEQLDHDKYAFILNHTVMSPTDFVSYVEGRYKSNVFSVMTNVDTEREIRMEVHLDKWRDVHLALTGVNEKNRKEFGAEVKWDANRDPALKLGVFFALEKMIPVVDEKQLPEKNLIVTVILTYPGCFVTTSCRVVSRGQFNYIMNATTNWNLDQTINLFVETDYVAEPGMRTAKLESQLLTPFETWKRTALNTRYLQKENRILLSGGAQWKDSQHVFMEFDGSTEVRDKLKEWRATYVVTSSVHSISWTTVNVTHKIIDSEVADTHLLVKYNPDKTIEAWSIWYLDKRSENVFNLNGNLHLESPVTSYKKSDMKCQLQILPDWKFLGAASLDLDKETYSAKLFGDLRRIKESTVEFNVTTPLEKFADIHGRFGLSESNRHVVAMVVIPSGPLGFEGLCQLFTASYDFNVKLMVATPLELLQRLLLVAKLNNREADFRVAYNNMLAGFQGVWHYCTITDFHYTYLLFTPIRGLEEIGVVAKLIMTDTEVEKHSMDTEFSIRLAEMKIGAKAKAGPKSPPVNIQIKAPLEIASNSTTQEEEDYGEDEEANPFYWNGKIEVYPAIVEPVLGELDIDYDRNLYKINAVVQYFQGKIIVDDIFFMEDLFNIRNELNVIAPFNIFNELVCLNVFIMDLENSNYTMQIAVNVKRNRTWTETGIRINYLFREDEVDAQSHNVALNVKTPLEFLKFFNTSVKLACDEDLYRVAVVIYAPNSAIETLVRLKTPKDLVNATVAMRIDTPMLRLPEWTLLVVRDFRSEEKHLTISGRLRSRSKSASLEAKWYAMKDRVRATVALRSWIEPLRSLEADVSYINAIATNDTMNLIVQVKHQDRHQYKLTGNYTAGIVLAELYTPKVSGPHFEFHGHTKKINETGYHVNGELLDLATKARREVFARIFGWNDTSLDVEVTTKSKSGTNVEDFDLRLRKWKYGVNVALLGSSLNGTLDANFINYFNWDLRARADALEMSGERKQVFKVNGTMNVQVNGYTTLYVHAETPIKGIENLVLNGNMLLTNNSGEIRVQDQVNEDSHRLTVQWKLVHMLDMMGRAMIGYKTKDLGVRDVDVRLFYMNPGRAFKNVAIGFDVDVDREKWKFAVNASGSIQGRKLDGLFAVRLPPPDNDDHRFVISTYGIGDVKDASYVIGYNALRAKRNYASDGSIYMSARDLNVHLRASWGRLPVQTVNNLFNMTFDNKEIKLKYSLYTPKFQQQETLLVLFNYDAAHDTNIRLIGTDIYFPASTKIGSANVSFDSLVNVNGTAVISTMNVSQIECQFTVLTTLQRNKRYLKVLWPQDTAILDSDYTYRSHKLDSDLKGVFHVEVPLNTRHIGHLTYGYEKRPQVTTGNSEMTYNGEKVLQGRYNSKSESRAGFEKERIQITIENPYKPLGILYINQYEYSAGNEGTNYPTVEFKHVNLYRIDNRTAFNVAGESRIRTTHTGQDIHLKAIHFNRTVELRTDYQVLPGEFDQNASLSLSKDVWMSYRVNILNKTTEDVDNQFLTLSVSYPRRNITLDGFYWISREELSSELKLDWDRETSNPRTVGAQFNWVNVSSTDLIMQQRATFSLRHPSFAKTVYLQGELLKKDSRDLLNVTIVADYSTDPDKLFVLSGFVRDESNLPVSWRYVYQVIGKHPSTKLNLDVRGFVHKQEMVLFETINNGSYRRTFLTRETGQLNARLDLDRREVLFQRDYNEAVKYLYARYIPTEKQYIANGSIVNTPNLNATGAFFLDPGEKLTWMMLNYTPNAVESLRMYGTIPDARNTMFNIWRTYEEDFSISDVSFYLKLNHSRLVTSTLRWRPELRSDILNGIKQTALDIYNGLNGDADYWRQYVKTETVNVISDVWDDAQEDLREFINDWNNLKDLQTDLDELKTYLNNSYNMNDFYIKDLVDIGIHIVDELALRTHIQSLPNILNEIWEIMGESGQAIINSLLWVIETIKNALNKVSEIVSAILRGDSAAQVANIVEKLIEKYDKFVKDLHVSFIKYIENLWVKLSQSISQQWNRFLLMIEPLFIRFIHYLETVVWKASKEVVDFLYDRGNDIIASPYFDRFTKFTQDIDKLYRDIKANDIVTNVQKYSGLIIQFLKERYFTFVPFGKELKDVIDEIITELMELRKLPSIHYAIENMHQLYDKVYYVYNYIGVQEKLESIVRLIYSKLMDISQTALQAESRYREAKTKFIFDPNQGLMCLEQKLPMSWHAFNQTPEFHEIPEFRVIDDIKLYFVASNFTFWSLYRYKSYMEPLKWLPPFNAQAMIIGSQHFTSLDGRHLNFVGPCTYLLARDFVRNTFTILIKYDLRPDRVTHKIVILIEKDAIELDIFNDNIKIVSEQSPSTTSNLQLPIELENGTTYVYRAENVVTVERKQDQLRLECNLKFNLCTLELSGWYYGKTAGILGTMNNEPMDDTTASDGIVTNDVARFAGSWSIDAIDECPRDTNLASSVKEKDVGVVRFCDDLFVNKSSEFLSCFDMVDPTEYSTMCTRSASKSEACTVALSYMQTCMFHDTYLRIPDTCTSCTMMNGDRMAEGQFRRLEGENVPMSTDVVFIVEGKDCNRDVRQNRSIEQLIVQLGKEFEDRGLVDNRWSLVVFGADGVFERPRSVVFDGQIFTKNAARFVDYFDHVPVGDGSRDIFAAIVFATKLVFRAGVSKTFILMPCSRCEPENQTLDYSVLHEALLEHDITLHILMDGDFEFEKERMSKMFYGLDAINSYTRKDVKTLIGDVELRRHVKLSKSALGYCTPLSLEINGTIFSGDKLRFDKLVSIKKFISVFAKRVALTALPNPCQNCECTANNNGVTRMECIPCVYPMPVTVDYDAFNLNDSLTALQRVNVDYGQIDIDYS